MENPKSNQILVVEDFVSKPFQELIKALVEGSELPLYYNCDTMLGYKTNYPKNNLIEYPQFTHTFIDKGEIKSEWWAKIEPLLFYFMAKTGISFGSLDRCKMNLNPKISSAIPEQHFTIHTDYLVSGFTSIYYVNDSDGDTLFFNATGTEIVKKISPKQGTMVYFNNQIPHAGQPPKINDYRSVINFNWI